MKYKDTDEFATRVCEICDGHIGRGFDHAECSIIKKRIHGDSCERKNPKKKLSKKALDSSAIFFRDNDQ